LYLTFKPPLSDFPVSIDFGKTNGKKMTKMGVIFSMGTALLQWINRPAVSWRDFRKLKS